MKLDALQGQKVGLCVSGGLDSRTVARKLKDSGVDVMCFTADLAQPDEADIADVAIKMAPCGVDTVIVDLKARDVRQGAALGVRQILQQRAGGTDCQRQPGATEAAEVAGAELLIE